MEKTVEMAGLSCEGCAANVRERFEAVAGVQSVSIDLSRKTATVTSDQVVDKAALDQALADTKYKIVNELA
ncbi:heavy-metal-associated domain-containing protein [Enterococcus termitis]|uniref:Copper resistance protein CopZ n=1 Tax=Enterococcus termitis TaxID=332950 RepID=A0A1E5GD31_9ENTE|nr:heavy metal-associated domain-containing protein [Enterococcus termitis]OEG10636.1 copper resistance protein CopZ [Enterococcus termitis]OJG97899.1 hypothetical protein RV18_GL003913 [Enterococcus termitis]